MFNRNFYPTPENVVVQMLNGYDITGKKILEPSAGKGNIVDHLLQNGAEEVIACEINEDLKKIVQTKCKVIASDFLTVQAEDIPHIHMIVMNPPFTADERHILHAWEIAPEGCVILALCNTETLTNRCYSSREKLKDIAETYGSVLHLENCFSDSERKTDVEISLVRLHKPIVTENKNEFEGFFLEEDREEIQENGIMSYNVVRDLVNRYVAACKLFDEQMALGTRMKALTNEFFSSSLSFSCTQEGQPKLKADFKKDLQKAGWKFIFNKMNMQKHATSKLNRDINKFVEEQTHIPFTMKNIYAMLDVVIGTTGQRMDTAIIDVFDRLTTHYHDNRHYVEGWKTNSHYLVNEKFILPHLCMVDKWHSGNKLCLSYGGNFNLMEDFVKALCYISGDNWEEFGELRDRCKESYVEYGKEFDWAYFKIRAFKKGTMHFTFKDKELWGRLNQRIAKLKGYPLFEATTKQKEEGTKVYTQTKTTSQPKVLFSLTLNS